MPCKNQTMGPAFGVFSASFSRRSASCWKRSMTGFLLARVYDGERQQKTRSSETKSLQVAPIILRFFSGSDTPLRRLKNSSPPSTTVRLMPRCFSRVSLTCSHSLSRITPATVTLAGEYEEVSHIRCQAKECSLTIVDQNGVEAIT